MVGSASLGGWVWTFGAIPADLIYPASIQVVMLELGWNWALGQGGKGEGKKRVGKSLSDVRDVHRFPMWKGSSM